MGAALRVSLSEEKFVRTKPHVNVSGPYGISNETISASVMVVEPGTMPNR